MRLGRNYAEPELVLYSRRTPTPCADADGATGPFYCAADRFAAYDLVFFDGLDEALGSDSPRATPLLVAQIAASHVQNLLGILRDVERLRLRSDAATRAATDLRVALQADCLAGVWARRAGSRLGPVQPGGYAAVVAAAREIAVELEGRGHTAPSSYAALHLGAPEEREAGFAAGYERGALEDCLAPGLGGQLG
jgi:uncharacterized protein